MIALDTNVLVRLIVDDPKEQLQTKRAKSLLQNIEQVYITQIVQIETVWILETAYGFDKPSIITALTQLESHTMFKLQKAHLFSSALSLFFANNADFSDCLILLEGKTENCTLATFDKKLGQLPDTQLISSK